MKRVSLLCLTILLMLAMTACGEKNPGITGEMSTSDHFQTDDNSPDLRFKDVNGIDFTEVFSYSGEYVEDGTDDPVDNVAAVYVRNNSDRNIQYAEFTAETEAGEYHFTCTTLLPGSTMLILERDRAAYNGGNTNIFRIDSEMLFADKPDLYPDTLDISVSGNVMTVRNLSSEPITGDFYVYFKRFDKTGYVGGITYRVGFTDLAVGAENSRSAGNLSDTDCQAVFVTFQNPPGSNV